MTIWVYHSRDYGDYRAYLTLRRAYVDLVINEPFQDEDEEQISWKDFKEDPNGYVDNGNDTELVELTIYE